MTSYGERLNTAHLAIRSLMLQTHKPNRIILNLDSSVRIETLPNSLRELQQYGLEIRTGLQDIRPHKKYYFTMLDFPNSVVITADDDFIFDEYTVEDLVKGHSLYPECVITRRCHEISFDEEGTPLPYSEWSFEWTSEKICRRRQLLATGGAGTLYPARVFSKRPPRIEEITDDLVYTDDLYMKILEVLNGVDVVFVPNRLIYPYEIEHSQHSALWLENIEGERNDKVFTELLQTHGLTVEDFLDDR